MLYSPITPTRTARAFKVTACADTPQGRFWTTIFLPAAHVVARDGGLDIPAWLVTNEQLAAPGFTDGWVLATSPIAALANSLKPATPPAGLTRHLDCLLGDLAGLEEARQELLAELWDTMSPAQAHSAASRKYAGAIQALEAEIAKAEYNQAQGYEGMYVPPGNWRHLVEEGAACYYDGEREIAAHSWQLDANDPELWTKIERAAALP